MTSMSLQEYRALEKKKRPVKRRRTAASGKKRSPGEDSLAFQLKALKIAFSQEYRFHPTRKWRADFHLTDTKVLIEVEGGIWSNGRHTRGSGYLGDMEKYNEATALGYQILRFSTQQVLTGVAVEQIEKVLRV